MAGWCSSRRERRLWIWTAVATLAIYASLYFVRPPIEWLRAQNLLRVTVGSVFLLVAAAIVVIVLRRRPGAREVVALAVCGVVYLVALGWVERHEERLHFLEYGIVGALAFEALGERRRRGRLPLWLVPVLAVVVTSLAGLGDEAIQAVLPNRVYELRDAMLNVAAAVLVVLSLIAVGWARSADRRARGPETGG